MNTNKISAAMPEVGGESPGGLTAESPPTCKQPAEPAGALEPFPTDKTQCAVAGTSFPKRIDAEKALRGIGLSSRHAKRIIAGGWVAAFKNAEELDAAEVVEEIRKLIPRLRA